MGDPRRPATAFSERAGRAQRWVILGVAGASPILCWPPAMDAFDLVKLTAVLVGAGLVVALAAGRVVATGRLHVPRGLVVALLAAFAAGVVGAVALSDAPTLSVVGEYRRFGGLLLYASCAVLFLGVLRQAESFPRSLALALVAGATGVVAYGLVQVAAADPLPWRSLYGEAVFSTMGNPNFASGYLGAVLAPVVWGAMSERLVPALRAACAVLAIALVTVIVATGSAQGFAAAGAGAGVLAVAVVLGRPARVRRAGLAALAVVGLSTAGLAALGLAGRGPLSEIVTVNFGLRRYYFAAAWNMIVDNPVIGVGLDRYGAHYRAYRPLDAALSTGLGATNDTAHNVVLQLASGGGMLVGLTYLAVVVYVGWALVRGLRRLEGEQRLLLGGLGGAWAGYQAQALVSIDVPALAALHWLTAAGIVALAAPVTWRQITLPWARPVVVQSQVRGSRRPSPAVGRRGPKDVTAGSPPPALDPAQWLGGAVTVVLAALVCVLGTVPLRADLAAGAAQRTGDDAGSALSHLDRAVRLAPWEPTYRLERGRVHLQLGQPEQALEESQAAATLAPRNLSAHVTAARLAEELGDVQAAAALYQRALQIEPLHPTLKVEAARFHIAAGQPGQAATLLHGVLDVQPGHEEATALLDTLEGL